MRTCPACSEPLLDDARFCEACGTPAEPREDAATIEAPLRASRRGVEARFLPGTVLDRRYRIVAPLGRGGMGEVYRADDIKLGQTVALKFLPRALERDRERLRLLLDEVKLARQVSHPNVCRVWDAGESEGLHFLAMEYVDGEDLGSLLRRIGRLPEDRAVQVARELCAGLAAVHDQGLLHRDLKPANVMLDGRGRVRITDFGLAALEGTVAGQELGAGTPAYMAPEQRDGREVSARSDVYSLGLILYELFTGRSAFDGADPTSRGPDSRPTTPSSHLRTLDPIIERAILRCLEPDPAQRPAGALAVAASLPGGDPLAAAMAAGETPSPEMVAAAGGVGGLHPALAMGIALLVFGGIAGVLALSERRGLPFGPEDKPYAALRDRAAEFARSVGAATRGDDVRDGYSMTAVAPGDSAGGAAGRFYYWQRRSPAALLDVWEERTTTQPLLFAIPALEVPGECAQRLAPDGRLLEFRRIPRARDAGAADTADYAPFFAAAGLAGSPRMPTAPRLVPPVLARFESAWAVRTAAETRRVEAAAYAGEVTFFVVGSPDTSRPLKRSDLMVSTAQALTGPVFFVLAVVFARRNLRVGRADARGGIRLGLAVAVMGALGFRILTRPAGPPMGVLALNSFAIGLFWTMLAIASYLALEPIVRRRRPEWLASWTRLLGGRWRDPLVGRHVLFGTLGGVAMSMVGAVRGAVSGAARTGDVQAAAVGGWTAFALVLRGINVGILIGLLFVLLLVVLQMVTRRDALGWILFVPVAIFLLVGPPTPSQIWAPALIVGLFSLLLTRAGLTGATVGMTLFSIFNDECHTLHLDAWYAGVTHVCLLLVASFLVWGLVAATRTRAGTSAAKS